MQLYNTSQCSPLIIQTKEHIMLLDNHIQTCEA